MGNIESWVLVRWKNIPETKAIRSSSNKIATSYASKDFPV